MLKHWQTHAKYQQFISDAVSHLNESQRKKLSSYSHSIAKFFVLGLDPARDFMLPFYSSTGKPALRQPQFLRSFVLLMGQHCLGISSWVDTLAHDNLLTVPISVPLIRFRRLVPITIYKPFMAHESRTGEIRPQRYTSPCGKIKSLH